MGPALCRPLSFSLVRHGASLREHELIGGDQPTSELEGEVLYGYW
jgi:hypothetical protein